MAYYVRTKTWYATVGFGGNPAPKGPWDSPAKAARSIRRWLNLAGAGAGSRVAAHTIRVYGYETRQFARDGDISDELGRNGCIEMHGLYDFLTNYDEEES